MHGCTGDTLVQTRELGIVKMNSIVGATLHFWDGAGWTRGVVHEAGIDYVCHVHFKGDQIFKCSYDESLCVQYPSKNVTDIACKDLSFGRTSSSMNSHVLVSPKFEDSKFVYSSGMYRPEFTSQAYNARNVFIDDLTCSQFNKGVVLGRMASNGYYSKRGTDCVVRQSIAEHEYAILDKLFEYETEWEPSVRHDPPKRGRKEEMSYIDVYSTSLRNEFRALNLRYSISDNLLMDTELVRGLVCGWFDGDGTVGGDNIQLIQGNQADFEPLFRQIQKVLLFVGVRSKYHFYKTLRHGLIVTKADTKRFLQYVGFLNVGQVNKANKLHGRRDICRSYDRCLIVDHVDFTSDKADMYSVHNTSNGYYVADGIVVFE